ncbi:hypothetical protein CDAR_317441 [Caerostris darwini]|uniref:Uncharacterized protein n=1 Tax=Caerostris darwini TaxID=1538125 RepID=A0AAV4Q9L1_9ARAC|nr:hypothetical protein CDAR_317441 [Caerostris darwini]
MDFTLEPNNLRFSSRKGRRDETGDFHRSVDRAKSFLLKPKWQILHEGTATLCHTLNSRSPKPYFDSRSPSYTLTLDPPSHTLTLDPPSHTLTLDPPSHTLTPDLPSHTLTPDSPSHTLTPDPPCTILEYRSSIHHIESKL